MSEPNWELLGGGGVYGGPIEHKGAWAAGTAYIPGQVVTHNGIDYLAVRPSTGQTPPLPVGSGVPTTVGATDESVLTVDAPGSPAIWKPVPAVAPWTDTGWLRLGIDIPYVSAADYAVPYGGAGVSALRRLPSGLVVGKGLIAPPAVGGNCFTLPAGLRPASSPGVHIMNLANSGTEGEGFRIPTTPGAGSYATAWGCYMAFARSWVSLAGGLWLAEQ